MFCFIREVRAERPSIKKRLFIRNLAQIEILHVKATDIVYVDVLKYDGQSGREAQRVKNYVLGIVRAYGARCGIAPGEYYAMGLYGVDTQSARSVMADRGIDLIMRKHSLNAASTDAVLCVGYPSGIHTGLACRLAQKLRHVSVSGTNAKETTDLLYSEYGMAKKALYTQDTICVFWNGELPCECTYVLDVSGGAAECHAVRYELRAVHVRGYENNAMLSDSELIFALLAQGVITQNEILLDII